jgi:hypothetical protein
MPRRPSNETRRLREVVTPDRRLADAPWSFTGRLITLAKADKLVNPDFLNALLVAGYLLGGTICIVLLASWALRRFGKRRK